MNDLSIIIKTKEKELENYVKVLEPLLMDFRPELIIIDNGNQHFNLSYNYCTYKYSGDYSNFKEFCFSSSLGRMVIIIENGWQLSQEHIDLILKEIKNNDYLNISFNLKTYLSEDKSLYFTREEVFLYNRGIKGFNRNTGIIIEDISFIDDQTDIETNIKKLLSGKHFNELILWHERCIIKKSTCRQLEFYTALEKNKRCLTQKDILDIEELSLNSKANIKYIQYLKLKKALKDKNIDARQILKDLHNIEITEKDIYYCWLIKDLIVLEILPSCMIKWKENIQRALLYYLFENDLGAPNTMYHLIMIKSEDIRNHEYIDDEFMTVLLLLKMYMEYMNDQSEEPQKKENLLRIFDLYVEFLNMFLLRNKGGEYQNLYKDQVLFIDKFNEVKHKPIKEAITILKEISTMYPEKMNTIYYYIQKLKYENQYYPVILSICMITKDEEKNIERCLKSLKPLVDSKMAEIIIVDTGSTDHTIKLAEQYTSNIFSYKWQNDFSQARNTCNLFAEGEYIFILDADEEIETTEINKLIEEFRDENCKQHNTFKLRIKSYTNLEYTQYGVATQQRIFKNNGKFYYSHSVHNQPICDSRYKNLDVEILHYGYIMTEDIREKKFIRTTTLLKKMLEKKPRNIYYRYQLSSSYSMYGDLKEAIKQVDIFIRLIQESKFVKSVTLMYYNNAANIYLQGHRFEDADKITNVALSIQPDFIDFLYYKAYILFVKGKYEDALIYMNKYLSVSEAFFKLNFANSDAYTFYTQGSKDSILRLFIISHYLLEEYHICLEKVYEIEDGSTLMNSLHEIVGAYFNTRQYCELARFYTSRIFGNKEMEFIFKYFLMDHLFNCTLAEAYQCLSSIALENVDEELTKSLTTKIENEKSHNEIDTLTLISKYYIDGMDFESANKIFIRILPKIKNYNIQNSTDVLEIIKIKITFQCILHRTEDFIKFNIFTIEELLNIFTNYINLCITLINNQQIEFLGNKERVLISKITTIFSDSDKYHAIEAMNDAILYYQEMGSIVQLAINTRFSSVVKENNLSNEINSDLKNIKKTEDNIKLQRKADIVDQKVMKVLQGTVDLTSRTIKIAEALNSKGIYTKALNYFPNYLYHSDYEMDVTSFENNNIRLNNTIDVAVRLIPEFNIYHFHSFSSLTLDHSDLSVLKEMDKKLLMHFWGQDVRLYSKAAKLNPYIKLLPKNDDKETIRQMKAFSKHIKYCLVSDYELNEYVKDYFENIIQLNLMLDLKKIKQRYVNDKNRLFTIIHVSTSPELLGTKYVLEAINDLKLKYNINFKLIQDISYEEHFFQEADLIIDQLIIGRYGQVSIDAMALGKPVICWISDFMREKYPKELPIIIASPDNVKEKITYVLENRDMLKNLGIQGKSYVERYHDMDKEILKLIKIYKDHWL